jgi:spore coat protein U-like protein
LGRWRLVVAGLSVMALSTAASAACDVGVTSLPFGAYNPANASPTDASGTVTVTCTALVAIGLSWTITMSTGTSGSYSPRVLTNGASTLSYNIYTNSTRTTVWGDGTASTSAVSDSTLLQIGTNVRSYTMYGRIPALQDVRAGAYSDAIVVTITY